MSADVRTLYDVCEHTWPPAKRLEQERWVLRDGRGGGKRVSAATARRILTNRDVREAEALMKGMGQYPLFMIREGEDLLDRQLADMGYEVIDPVVMYTTPIDVLTDVPIPPVTAFCIWEPLAIMREIWATGGVGPARLDVMARAKTKTSVLSRWNEKPAGVAFAAVHSRVCMVHAVEVLPHQRRMGVAQWMMRAAAFWAKAQGADAMSVLCVEHNAAANALYQSLGFSAVGRYHYRQRPDEEELSDG